MKKTLCLALILVLGGCGTNKNSYEFSQELDRQVGQIAALRVQYQQRMNDSSFDLIRNRVALSGNYPHLGTPCLGAATDTYPTEAEKAALKHFTTERNAFLTQLAALAKPTQNAPERMARFMERLDKANFEAAAEISVKLDALSQGSITYCEYARAVRAVNGEAHRETAGARNALDEETALDWHLRMGFPPSKMIYAAVGPQ